MKGLARFKTCWELDPADLVRDALVHGHCPICEGVIHDDDWVTPQGDGTKTHKACLRTKALRDAEQAVRHGQRTKFRRAMKARSQVWEP